MGFWMRRPMSEGVPPGGTIGILGGGQLGRMTALAAARLGLRAHCFDPDPAAPAAQVCNRHVCAPYNDAAALADFAASVDVATYEFENIPYSTVEAVARDVPVFPGPNALAVCQDRRLEKRECQAGGHGTAAWHGVSVESDLADALAVTGLPAILKTAREGYDGKGQRLVETAAEAVEAWRKFGGAECVLEAVVEFEREVSVIVARDRDRQIAAYPPVENQHERHILARTIAPADLTPGVVARADAVARDLAGRLKITGLLAVEMFVTSSGEVLVNEMAPRPHNSGHWTMEGCRTDQFEQLVRAICGWPLGAVEPVMPCVMTNILGPDDADWEDFAARTDGRLHLYGKKESRPGRKMGHFTQVGGRSGG